MRLLHILYTGLIVYSMHAYGMESDRASVSDEMLAQPIEGYRALNITHDNASTYYMLAQKESERPIIFRLNTENKRWEDARIDYSKNSFLVYIHIVLNQLVAIAKRKEKSGVWKYGIQRIALTGDVNAEWKRLYPPSGVIERRELTSLSGDTFDKIWIHAMQPNNTFIGSHAPYAFAIPSKPQEKSSHAYTSMVNPLATIVSLLQPRVEPVLSYRVAGRGATEDWAITSDNNYLIRMHVPYKNSSESVVQYAINGQEAHDITSLQVIGKVVYGVGNNEVYRWIMPENIFKKIHSIPRMHDCLISGAHVPVYVDEQCALYAHTSKMNLACKKRTQSFPSLANEAPIEMSAGIRTNNSNSSNGDEKAEHDRIEGKKKDKKYLHKNRTRFPQRLLPYKAEDSHNCVSQSRGNSDIDEHNPMRQLPACLSKEESHALLKPYMHALDNDDSAQKGMTDESAQAIKKYGGRAIGSVLAMLIGAYWKGYISATEIATYTFGTSAAIAIPAALYGSYAKQIHASYKKKLAWNRDLLSLQDDIGGSFMVRGEEYLISKQFNATHAGTAHYHFYCMPTDESLTCAYSSIVNSLKSHNCLYDHTAYVAIRPTPGITRTRDRWFRGDILPRIIVGTDIASENIDLAKTMLASLKSATKDIPALSYQPTFSESVKDSDCIYWSDMSLPCKKWHHEQQPWWQRLTSHRSMIMLDE